MKILFKILAVLFAVFFVWAAYVQNNDPDATMWYAIYGIAAVASLLFIANKLPYALAVILFLGYVIGAIVFWPSKFEGVSIGAGDINNIEHGRESLGLIINALIMLIYAWRIKRK